MIELPENIEQFVFGEKEVASVPNWNLQDGDRHVTLLVPLSWDGIIYGDISLRIKISKEKFDRDAMMQLEFGTSKRNSCGLWRLDWKPFHSHSNNGRGPEDIKWNRYSQLSHSHGFTDNYYRLENRMINNIPIAREITPEPKKLEDFFTYCGKEFNIINIGIIGLPTIEPDLFWE